MMIVKNTGDGGLYQPCVISFYTCLRFNVKNATQTKTFDSQMILNKNLYNI